MMGYYHPRTVEESRFVGPLLPFLAGVLVTTPFIFLNNNKNNSYQAPPYPYPYPYPVPTPYYPSYAMPYTPYR